MTFVFAYDTTNGLEGEEYVQEHGSLAVYGPLADRRKFIGSLVNRMRDRKVVQANFQRRSLAAVKKEVGLYDDKYPASPVLVLLSHAEDQDARDYARYLLKRGAMFGITAVIGFDRITEGMGPVASKSAGRVVAIGENRDDTYKLLMAQNPRPEVAAAVSEAYVGWHWMMVPALLV